MESSFEKATSLADQFFGLALPVKAKELKRSYRSMCMLSHPDRGGSEEEFKALQDAYGILTKMQGKIPGVFCDANGDPSATTEGIPLSELGLGLGSMKNGKDCPDCGRDGYETHRGSHRVECDTCDEEGFAPRRFPCRDCKGSGRFTLMSGNKITCRKCGGTGRFKHPFLKATCYECLGTKEVWSKEEEVYYTKCWRCEGRGELELFNPVLPKGRLTALR